jgi:hypothetical protein
MSINKPKIVSIMPVWNEQQMIALSIASTKDIVYQYIVLIKKGTYDKTREVLNYIKENWNLNMIIIESELKLRERRKYAIEISKDYADYYLIQDADEIYFNNSGLNNDTQTILKLIRSGYTFCLTSIIFLEKDFLHTPKDENQIWLTPHPFLFKNTSDIYWPDIGDMPAYDPNNSYHNIKYQCLTCEHEIDMFMLKLKYEHQIGILNSDIKKFYDKLTSKTIEIIDGDEKYVYQTSNGNEWELQNLDRKTDTYQKVIRKDDFEKLLSDRKVKINII